MPWVTTLIICAAGYAAKEERRDPILVVAKQSISRLGKAIIADTREPVVNRNTRKVMVVCSDVSDSVKAHLDCDSWYVNWVDDAKAAIAKVRRERFDLAVLIATGNEMDMTETLFNLRDSRQSMPIAVVQPNADTEETLPKAAYLRADKNLIALQNLDDLASLLQKRELSVIGQSS
jgi:hypothetical protein